MSEATEAAFPNRRIVVQILAVADGASPAEAGRVVRVNLCGFFFRQTFATDAIAVAACRRIARELELWKLPGKHTWRSRP